VLLPRATRLAEADAACKALLTADVLRDIVSLIPDTWLQWPDAEGTPDELRAIYARFLLMRLERSATFTTEAQHARQALV
jgi:hypothetical protein